MKTLWISLVLLQALCSSVLAKTEELLAVGAWTAFVVVDPFDETPPACALRYDKGDAVLFRVVSNTIVVQLLAGQHIGAALWGKSEKVRTGTEGVSYALVKARVDKFQTVDAQSIVNKCIGGGCSFISFPIPESTRDELQSGQTLWLRLQTVKFREGCSRTDLEACAALGDASSVTDRPIDRAIDLMGFRETYQAAVSACSRSSATIPTE